MKTLPLVLTLALAAHADLVKDVRAKIAEKDFAGAEKLVRKAKKKRPETILALSWLGRGAQANQRWDDALRYSAETRKAVLGLLKKRKLDADKELPLALGASIEVQAHAMAARGERSEAVLFLREELKQWHDTSIRTRTQKNLNLLSLEGAEPLPLEMSEWLGEKPRPLAEMKGKPVLLFFWAHWCPDCKAQGPLLKRIIDEFAPAGLQVISPTQPYGYVAGGKEVPRAEEVKYIEEVRLQYYAETAKSAPVSEENFKVWGCSSTPTLVLLDREGLVRMYRPGKMTYEELKEKIAALMGS